VSELSWRTRIGWGLGSLPGSALAVTANVLLMRFMTDTLGIGAAVAGSLFATAKLWDAFVDPLIGTASDRLRTPWGQRLPWILVGGVLAALVMVAAFWAPIAAGPGLLAYMAVMLLLFATTYSMLMIPYLTMPAEIEPSYHGRTQMMSIRVLCSSAGSTLGLGLMPFLLSYWGATRAGHFRGALLIAAIAIVAILLCVWMLRDVPRPVRPVSAQPPLRQQLRSALDNRPFLWLLTAKFLYFVVLAFSITTFAYFTKHVLKTSDAWLGTFLTIQSIAVVASQPMWLRISRGLGKKTGFMIAGLAYGLGHLSWWFASANEPVALIFARAVTIGLAGGGTFLFMQAMLPDALEYDRLRTGQNRAGIFTGIFVFVEQASSAVGAAVIGLLLGALGYVAATEGRLTAQPESALLGIYLCMSVIPFVLLLFSLLAISRYNLTEKALVEMRAQVASAG
jgi:GPH family glycoside/pentoside/hexuronide:cation symporter